MALKLLVVGEGERDRAAVPKIIERILARTVDYEFERWPRLHGAGRGYRKKLRFALLQVANRGLAGLVATVDSDTPGDHKHLPELYATRDEVRASGDATRAALGEAIPHLEAWLLDDDVAVRTALNLTSDTVIAAPTKVKSPKVEIDRLCESHGITTSGIEILTALAAQLDVGRCVRCDHTGFKEFTEEVKREIGALCMG